MTTPFSMTVTDAGTAICQMSGRKAACVRAEPKGYLGLKPKIIDRRRLPEFFTKALGAAELLAESSDKENTAVPGEIASTKKVQSEGTTVTTERSQGRTKTQSRGESTSTS